MTGQTWLVVIGAVIGTGGISGVLGSLLIGLIQRPKTRAEAVNLLTDAALRQVNELQERTSEAEKEATGARNEAAAARHQVRLLTAEVDACMAKLRAWRAAIFAPDVTVDSLRTLVGHESGVNGTGIDGG